ncbi:MAG: diguanylate cyclase, partial [Spirochaetes bacterium]|nr:diguanylate cyclase [Spirochaetota bacterium]
LNIKPDAIILDYDLPEISGFEICTELIKDRRTRFIPVLILAESMDSAGTRIMQEKNKVEEFLIKPCDPDMILITIEKLIQKAEELKALQPLTQSQDSISVKNQIRKNLEQKKEFFICYIDIDFFKPYNEGYGFQKGNEVIVFLENVILKAIKKHRNSSNESILVGHISGDDFVITAPIGKVDNICNEIIENFDKKVSSFYNENDRKQKLLKVKNPLGKVQKYPLMRISISTIGVNKKNILNYEKISSTLTEINNYLKNLPNRSGSIYFKERRKRNS